ncbi:hypothetical protein AVEN_9002-1 [Araneus ventricosus]|uniref:Uncharacterized protein n=1 Tax=Araneus ventricosus TaxID=182803 RepID=A0A4Y2DSA5_ARAVE|nr:hypothetical protein AVEN_9002-1 [Araneus ventricosus]
MCKVKHSKKMMRVRASIPSVGQRIVWHGHESKHPACFLRRYRCLIFRIPQEPRVEVTAICSAAPKGCKPEMLQLRLCKVWLGAYCIRFFKDVNQTW